MDLSKARNFNARMGRIKYSKGGYIKKLAGRKYFDDGGAAIASNITPAGVGGPEIPQTQTGLASKEFQMLLVLMPNQQTFNRAQMQPN